MRVSIIALLAVLTACQSADKREPKPAPDVTVLVSWSAGTRFAATVTGNLPDDPEWRAVPVWWQEALGQTERFSLASQSVLNPPDLQRCELTVDPESMSLLVTLRAPAQQVELAQASFAPRSSTPSLLQAIDLVAWQARLALGEKATEPKAVAAITSANPKVVVAVADAVALMNDGGFSSSHRTLRVARQRDGGAPFILDRLSYLELLRGDADAAERISREALSYAERASQTVQHRLLRTLLMARSAKYVSETESFDKQLAMLASVARLERPYDDEPIWTAALAHNFQGEFKEARGLLEQLLSRKPGNPFVPYHLGWACLGMNDATAASGHLATAAVQLPQPWVLLPRAIALFEAGLHEELEALLSRVLAESTRSERDPLIHQVRRMQAAHAILQNQPDRARTLLLEDLSWLQRNPLVLTNHVGEFAEEGALLVRLGSSKELPVILSAVQKQHVASIAADASAFISGMHQVQTTGIRARKLEQELGRDGDSPWSSLLAAFAHERLGEVGDMQSQLAAAARLSGSAMTKALLAKSLRAVGKDLDARRLRETLRRELVQIHLRRSCQHPLFGPELAYAFVLQ